MYILKSIYGGAVFVVNLDDKKFMRRKHFVSWNVRYFNVFGGDRCINW